MAIAQLLLDTCVAAICVRRVHCWLRRLWSSELLLARLPAFVQGCRHDAPAMGWSAPSAVSSEGRVLGRHTPVPTGTDVGRLSLLLASAIAASVEA